MEKNPEALKLPDPLLVRYFRAGKIDDIAAVAEDANSRDITVTLTDGTVERWQYLGDLGWIPQPE